MRQQNLRVLVLVLAIINILAEYLDIPGLIYSSKPLTTLLILIIAFTLQRRVSNAYKRLILIGLAFSLLGDVLLMLPYELFIYGLSSFLVAQIFFFLAFREGVPLTVRWLPTLLIVSYGVIVYWFLAPGLGGLRIPVLAYLIVIVAMLWQAWHRQMRWNWRSTQWAAIGASAFVLSDTFLAFNKFRVEFFASTALVLSTYYFALWCISQSISNSLLTHSTADG